MFGLIRNPEELCTVIVQAVAACRNDDAMQGGVRTAAASLQPLVSDDRLYNPLKTALYKYELHIDAL